MLADYHIHTSYSDDSIEPMENQIKKAIELGLKEICFTDHVDYGIKKDWSEGNIEYYYGDGIGAPADQKYPLANVNYPEYFAEIDRLARKYKDVITIKKGLEFGIQRHTVERYQTLYNTWKDQLDFVLLSIHQVDNKEFWKQDYQKDKTQKQYNEGYYNELLTCMNMFDDFCSLAHLDSIVRYDLNGVYPFEKIEPIIAEILKTAISRNKALEINTSCWHYKLSDTTPSRDIIRLYRDLGGKMITIGSDAHSTKYLADHFSDTIAMLKDFGFEYFCTYSRMVPEFHKL